jgi:hypothetical protein
MGILDLDPTQSQDITPEMAQRRRLLASAMLQQGMNSSPVQSWTQGAARIADALFGGLNMRSTDEAEAAARRSAAEADKATLASIFAGGIGNVGGSTKTSTPSETVSPAPSVAHTSTMTMPSGPIPEGKVTMIDQAPEVSPPPSSGVATVRSPGTNPDAPNPPSLGAWPFPSSSYRPSTVPTPVDAGSTEGGLDISGLARTVDNPYSSLKGLYPAIATALIESRLKPRTPIVIPQGGVLAQPDTGQIVARGEPKSEDTEFTKNFRAANQDRAAQGLPPVSMAEYHASTSPIVQKTVQSALNDVQDDQELISKFDRALELSKVAYAGHAATERANAVGWTGSKAAAATQELQSLTSSEAIGQLAQIHGGRMSPAFLSLLTNATGAVNQEQSAREAIFTRIKDELAKDIEFKQRLAKSAAEGSGISTDITTSPTTTAKAKPPQEYNYDPASGKLVPIQAGQ